MAVIQSVLVYASPVWHYSITSTQLESIQKQAVHITCHIQLYPWNVIS